MVWARDGSNLGGRGERMLWSSQRWNTNQGRVGPDWNGNMPAHERKCVKLYLQPEALPTPSGTYRGS